MQVSLFHESINDALREVVAALGGTKKIGALMRPEKSPDEAARWVSDCLNADRREKFNPEHVLWLLREGRKIGCHAAMNFIAQDAGYSAQPIEPRDEMAELQRQYIEAAKNMGKLADRIERMQTTTLKAVA